MTFDTLIALVDKAYGPDELVLAYHREPDVDHGDGLAKFIVVELKDTFDAENTLPAAIGQMTMALDDIQRVLNELEEQMEQVEDDEEEEATDGICC